MTDMNFAHGRRNAWKARLVIALGAIAVAFALTLAAPGHLSIDEMLYDHMARSLWDAGSLAVRNGYRDAAVPPLSLPLTVVHEGALMAQYPPFHAVIAAPFYGALGYRGLFVLNALAFCGLLWLTWRLALRVFEDRALALDACLILALATYAWDYAQAAWPHALSALFVLAAAYAALRALDDPAPSGGLRWAFAAGLIAGAGVGVRIDTIFTLPALVVPLLFARPARPRAVLAVAAGLVPGLAVLAAINQARFGIASPFTYGRASAGGGVDPWSYVPLFALGLVLLAVLWTARYPAVRAAIGAHRRAVVAGTVLAGGAALAVPEIWAVVARLADGAWQLVVDLRVRDLGIAEGGLARSPGGGMIYMGLLKKSLLQSCPYLAALLVPAYALARGRRRGPALALLLLVPASFVGAYAYFAWHGGLSLNMRYFVPVLPFTSILAAYALARLMRRAERTGAALKAGAVLSALLIVAAIALPRRLVTEMPAAETTVLTVPLILAGAIGVAVAAAIWAPASVRAPAARAALAALAVAFTWSGIMGYAYDFPRAWGMRAQGVVNARKIVAQTGPDAVVAVEHPGPVSGLIDYPRITMLWPERDGFASFRMLVARYAAAGRAVYGHFSPTVWRRIRERGYLRAIDAMEIAVIADGALMRLEPREVPAMGPAAARAANP